MKYLLCILALIFSNQSGAQTKLRPEIKKLADSMSEDIYRIDIGPIGTEDYVPEQWTRYKTLSANATNEELVLLTRASSAVVRVYAFDALLERKHTSILLEANRLLQDKSIYDSQWGCIGSEEIVSEHVQRSITGSLTGTSVFFNDKEPNVVDSIMLYSDFTPNIYLRKVLERIISDNKSYERIKEIYIIHHEYSAITALKKYYPPLDKTNITDLLSSDNNDSISKGLIQILWNDNNDYFSYLRGIYNRSIKKGAEKDAFISYMIFENLLTYETEDSKKLLESSLTIPNNDTREYNNFYLFLALKRNPIAYFDGIKEKIVLTHEQSKLVRFPYR
jgi:hypothetical protein